MCTSLGCWLLFDASLPLLGDSAEPMLEMAAYIACSEVAIVEKLLLEHGPDANIAEKLVQ